MSQIGSPASDGTVEPALAPAFAAWAAVPSLAPALDAAEGVHLVIDPGDGRIVHASAAAAALAAALTAGDSADLARQIASIAPGGAAPRLVRLRVDPRRIAPPVLCLLARGARADGAPVILLAPTVPVHRFRRRSRPAADLVPAPEPEPVAIPSAPSDIKPGYRFVWRSDAAGLLIAASGAAGLSGRVGQDLSSLVPAGPSDGGETLRAALSGRRTFRAIPVMLDLGDGPLAVDLSGAPMGRGDAAFSGFGGFGIVRRPVAAAMPDLALPKAVEPPGPPIHPIDASPDATRDPIRAPVDTTCEEQASDRPPDDGAVATPDASGSAPSAAALSIDEHAAFREIARALGARYAGDEPDDADATLPRTFGGSVTRFRGTQAEPTGDATSSAVSHQERGLLAGLPLPALVLRDATILAANPPLLDLTGFTDVMALNEAGIGRLFRGLAPDATGRSAARTTTIETAAGQTRPVELMHGTCIWEGEPAACLVLRPLTEDETAPALAAERLAREVLAARATGAEAALDAIEAGVVTVDAAGRVVTLNRAAAGLFGCVPREVVGGSFVGLFEARNALDVSEALRGAGDLPRAVRASGRTLMLDLGPARADGRRVAVLNPRQAPEPPGSEPNRLPPEAAPDRSATDGSDRKAFLDRLDRSVRGPTAGIVELADAMLREPFGALGDPRYRHGLSEIKVSGERMLERVGELLDIAAVEAGSLDLDPRPIALNEVVAACVARLQGEAARGRIVLRTSFSADVAELEADERSVSRAACLVIEHAIRRSSAGGQVIVSTGAVESAQIALRVRDMGAGRQEAGQSRDPGDYLALPRALVEANGGRLSLDHRADEDGTLVEIVLPRCRTAGA